MSAEFIVSYLICIFIKWLWDLAGKPFIENNTVLLPFWVLVFSSGDILVDKRVVLLPKCLYMLGEVETASLQPE